MAILRVTIFVTFACLVNAFPQVERFDLDHELTLTGKILSHTILLDGSLKEVAFVNMSLALYNLTQESYQLVSSTVRSNLADIPLDSEPSHDSLMMYEGDKAKLPLIYNVTLYETVITGPTLRGGGIIYHLDVYAKKKHSADVLASVKNFAL